MAIRNLEEVGPMHPSPPPKRALARLYYAVAALLLATLACLPFLVPLSFALLGFEQGLQGTNTPEAFEAYRASAPLRQGFVYIVAVLAALVLALSATVLVLRWRGRPDLPGAAPVAAAALAAILALAVVLAASVVPHAVLCC